MRTTKPGASGGHHEEAPTGASPEAIKAGHEPDAFAVKPIMSIPIAVVLTFVVAFAVAAGVFAYFMNQAARPNPLAHPDGVARGSVPLTQRLERIDRAGSNANTKREVDQPRLEPLKRLAAGGPATKGEDAGRFTTQLELPNGNSPQIHPEEIQPDRVAALKRAEYIGNDKKFARIPIADAMKIAVEGKGIFPVQAAPSAAVKTADKPSASSGGHGIVAPAPKPVAPKIETAAPPSPAAPKVDPPKGPTPASEKK